jgi:leucine-rich repeat protein SHOC2
MELPKGIEELIKLEILLMNDNKISKLPTKLGNLSHLKKLFIHNNSISEIPIEIHRLNRLKEFSLEWFIYLSPPMPKIMRDSKGMLIID